MKNHPITCRILTRILALIGAFVILCTPAGIASAADPDAQLYEFEGNVNPEGVLHVVTRLTYDQAPEQITQRIALRQSIDERSAYIFDVQDVAATIGGSPAEVTVEQDGEYLVVSINTARAGNTPIELSYNVTGATHSEMGRNGALTVVQWRGLQGLSTGVAAVRGSMRVPGPAQMVDCLAGPPGSVARCEMFTVGAEQSGFPEFESGARGPGEMVSFSVGVDERAMAATSSVEQEWSLDRAFTADPLRLLTALGVLVLGLGLLYLLFRRTGLDHTFEGDPTRVATFKPVADGHSVFAVEDAVRPGEVGTLADERVDPVDITGTLLDLAVRGHVQIEELPRAPHAVLDWKLTRTKDGNGELAGYEKHFLDAIAPVGGSSLVSELPKTLAPALANIQDELYEEVVRRGWFGRRPDATRSSWRTLALVSIAVSLLAACALIAFTTWGLVALVLVIVAATLYWISDRMPRRTVAGSRLLAGLKAVSMQLSIHPTDRMPVGREIAEISKLLPYAVVLGGKDRWIAAMVQADPDETPDPDAIAWYRAPETWHLQDLPASLTQFITTVQGELYGR